MIYKSEKSLIETNPHLQDPKKRRTQFSRAVVSSSKIEGVAITSQQLKKPAKLVKK